MIDEQGAVLTKRAYPFIADVKDGRAFFLPFRQQSVRRGSQSLRLFGHLWK